MILPKQTGVGWYFGQLPPQPMNTTMPSWLFRAETGACCGNGRSWQPGSWTLDGPPLTPPWVLTREAAEAQILKLRSSASALSFCPDTLPRGPWRPREMCLGATG